MNKIVITILLLLLIGKVSSQEIPKIKVGEDEISVQKLKISTSILGDIALTTYDMEFYNPNNRILEGELSFPLGENQSVTRFALDINGSLREAVVVEKEKARVAFESSVRRRIDPALLEQTKGNNYKARIYPIPAKGYKRVVIAFKQKLWINKNSYYYKLPLNFKDKLEAFSFSIEVLNQKNKPIFKKGMKQQFYYNAEEDLYYAKIDKKNKRIAKPILIKIPLNINKEKIVTSKDYFYFTKQLHLESKKNVLENDITVFWDTSLSQKTKNITSELLLLDTYFKKVENCKVHLVTFNTEIKTKKRFDVKQGNWLELKKVLENTVYDGASSIHCLKEYVDSSKANLLFTDGLNTLSNKTIYFSKKTYIINSLPSANHLLLKQISNASGGVYINLLQNSVKKSFENFFKPQLQFLGTNLSKEKLEVYPIKGSIVSEDFSLTGKGNFLNKKVKVYLGYGKDTIKTISFTPKKRTRQHYLIPKIWAQYKLNEFVLEKEKNEQEIIEISKKYGVISPFTSLLILDRVEDYVAHQIEPPKELKKEYDRLLAKRKDNKKAWLASLQVDLFNEYHHFFEWYETDHKKLLEIAKKKAAEEAERRRIAEEVAKKKEIEKEIKEAIAAKKKAIAEELVRKKSRKIAEELAKIREENRLGGKVTEIVKDIALTEEGFIISGVVSDTIGGLPGVSVTIKGTNKSTETDVNGNYTIKVEKEGVLVYSLLGMKDVEVTIVNSNGINVVMEEGEFTFDEVVVTGYLPINRKEYTLAAASIQSESIEKSAPRSIEQSLEGSQRNPRANPSTFSNSELLYVVDGKPVSKNPKLQPNEIHASYMLEPAQSTAIFGVRAVFGAVIITTKKGHEEENEVIENLEELVKEKIELKGWNPKTPYLEALNKIKDIKEAYKTYLKLRETYGTSPSFYIDVADFFRNRKEQKIAIQVLTNVAEIDLDNYELLKALAYKFEEYELYEYAVYIFKEILKLRPEDIQSYRDLALAYEHTKAYQKSVDLLYKIVNGELLEKDQNRRFSGIEMIALSELNRMISLYKEHLDISHIDEKFIKEIQTDIRVLIDWNHNDTDIDLWVIDPNEEKCYYSHRRTKIGGLMSNDMTRGFGPEQFILRKAIKGKYLLKVKYYSNSQQKISGPTFLKITVFKNYGKENEIKTTQLVRLKDAKEVLEVGKIKF